MYSIGSLKNGIASLLHFKMTSTNLMNSTSEILKFEREFREKYQALTTCLQNNSHSTKSKTSSMLTLVLTAPTKVGGWSLRSPMEMYTSRMEPERMRRQMNESGITGLPS